MAIKVKGAQVEFRLD